MTKMKAAGPGALDKWKEVPIGGEIRPEAWGKVFDEVPGDPQIQDFARCVEETHATWLMDSGIFGDKQPEGRRERAEGLVREMGYELYVRRVGVERNGLTFHMRLEIENRGVAPFYYDWPVNFALLSQTGEVVESFRAQVKIIGLLPGQDPHVWEESLDASRVATGSYHLALGVLNPMPGGHPVRFANETQDQHAPGWLSLADVELP